MITENKLGALGVVIGDALEVAFAEVSPSAAALLLSLMHRPELKASELAAVAGIAQPTVVRVADGLERRGWLRRGARQGRTTPLRLTAAGRRRAQALEAARQAAMARLLGPLSGGERAQFEAFLDVVLAAATGSRAQARTLCRLCDHGLCRGAACPIGSRATALERAAREESDADRA